MGLESEKFNEVIGHIDRENNKIQTLYAHLLNTGNEAARIGSKVGLENTCFLLGIFHDSGKADPYFQNYIKNNTRDKVIHSNAGAKLFGEFIVEEKLHEKHPNRNFYIYLEMMSYVIEAHHSLFDCIITGDRDSKQEGISRIFEKYNYDSNNKYNYALVKSYFQEVKKTLEQEEVYLADVLDKSFDEFLEIADTLEFRTGKLQEVENFYIAMLTRLLLSILKSADVKDTINAYDIIVDDKDLNFSKEYFFEQIQNKYEQFKKPKGKLNKIRTEIADQILKRGLKDSTGIYSLTLPTGAGKTLVSFRYAAAQIKEKNKERFFYITAFLSVLEQNASEIREIIKDDDLVLEHHSNIVESSFDSRSNLENEDEDREKVIQEYLKDTWDSPCVLSTMVQFFNTLFKGKSDNLRRFSSFIQSVIVLDEVQSLPIKVNYMMNLAFNFMKKVMNTSIILCTATQPQYDHENIQHKLDYGGINGESQELYELSARDFEAFKRVEMSYIKDDENYLMNPSLIKRIVNELEAEKNVLSISNTKAQVKKLYDGFLEYNEEAAVIKTENIYYLSTNLCAAHRLTTINEIKEKIKNNEQVLCFSTQLIEAGVDIDFDVVYRSLAGFDSIVQAAGRCNREGKLESGEVFIYKTSEENTKSIKEIYDKISITDLIIDKSGMEIELNDTNDLYFNRYFSKYSNEMNYRVNKDSNLFDLFSSNLKASVSQKNIYLKQAFQKVANTFNLIENANQYSVIVEYEESRELIYEFYDALENYHFKKAKGILKKLQAYTVNLYNLDALAVEKIEEFNIYIYKGNYDSKLGIVEEIGLFLL